jgi:hypothetical protein
MKSAKLFFRLGPALSVALGLLVSGCGSGSGDPSLVSVSGTVTHSGNPVAGATVTFHALEGSGSAFGMTDADGVYSLTTAPGNSGARPGDYAVTITKIEISGGDDLPEDHPDYGKKPLARQSAKSVLPEKYGDPKSSGLTVTVEEKSTSIDFVLDAK